MNRGFLSVCFIFLIFGCKIGKSPIVQADIPEEIKVKFYDAELVYLTGNFIEAKQQFEEINKQHPTAAAFYRLACMKRDNREFAPALEEIGRAIKLDTANTHYLLFEAGILEKLHRYTEAGVLMRRLAVTNPSRWSFFTDAARYFKLAKSHEELISHCREWEKAFGTRIEIIQYSSEAYLHLDQPANAAGEWKRLIHKHPGNHEYFLSLAKIYQRSEMPDSAILIYESLNRTHPGNPDVIDALCHYYQDKSDKQGLWKHARSAATLPDLDIWRKQQCLTPFFDTSSANLYKDSLTNLLKILTDIHPNEHTSWMLLSNWLYSQKQYFGALEIYARSLSLNSNDFQAWSRYANCLERCGLYQRMIAVTDSMLELFPTTPAVEKQAAMANLLAGNGESAKEHCETGLSFSIDTESITDLNLLLARVLNSIGKTAEAYQMLKGLRERYPDNSDIQAELAWLYALNNHETPEAEKLIEDALNANRSAKNYFIRAQVQQAGGKKEDAVESLKTAVTLDEHPLYLIQLGDLLSNTNTIMAKQHYNRAWEIGFRTPELARKAGIAAPKNTN